MIRFILASLRYHWRMNGAVALGAAVAVGVLVGALAVGDSMRESLRRLALDRLGRIDLVVSADRPFRAELADELAETKGFSDDFDQAVPVLLLRGSLTRPNDEGESVRANRVNVIGCDKRFWQLSARSAAAGLSDLASGGGESGDYPYGRSIVLNRPLAEQLGASVGDTVYLRLARPGTIPSESPLGRRGAPVSLRLRVGAIIEPSGLGAFALDPSQRSVRNAYVSLETLQDRLDQPGRAGAILVAGRTPVDAPAPESEKRLAALLRPGLADLGLDVERSDRGYRTLSTDRLVFSLSAETAILNALKKTGPERPIQPALTWLANTIACRGREIPYSTITAVDFADEKPLGPMLDQEGRSVGPLADDRIVLNSWAADDLGAKLGDPIQITYFEPESPDGRLNQRTAVFRLAAIVPLVGAAIDRDLLPRLPGVTDRLTMDGWDPPFPLDAERIRPKDEDYWRDYRGTPKAFVSLAAGRRLWASRFGRTTTLRVAGATNRAEVAMETPPVTKQLHGQDARGTQGDVLREGAADATFASLFGVRLPPEAMGFVVRPVKRQSLAASSGTTSFNLLFLGFSFFIIVAAVLLVVLLARLGVELRGPQIGLLLAVGWPREKIARALAAEGALVALIGSVLGAGLGVGYAALMLAGLETWWLPAIGARFLRLHVAAGSLVVGAGVGLVLSLAAIRLSVRQAVRSSPRRLMAGAAAPRDALAGAIQEKDSLCRALARKARWMASPRALAIGLLVAAAGLVVAAARLGHEFQAGAFFGAGAMALAGLLAAMGQWLIARNDRTAIRVGRGNLTRLAVLGAARHPARSTLSMGLVAVACFLIVSVSAFRVEPSGRPPDLHGGNGRFTLVGQSDLPIVGDLGTRDGRSRLGFSDDDNRRLDNSTIISFRVQSGDDASCLNLYRPRQPRILGAPAAMIARDGFAWADAADRNNPWQALAGAADATPAPMALERDTATYSLHLDGLGSTYAVDDNQGRPVRFVVVGLLKGSPFQGDLLISEKELLRHWPEVTGYRFFLIDCPGGETAAVRAALERTLGDHGFAAVPMDDYLAAYLAVPNTYLSTFQSLGGLGLLLGTLGLAVVQWRNVLERRRELALLRAVGLRRRQIAWLVLAENGSLLLSGMACGTLAAAVAVLPHFISGDASIPLASLAGTLAVVLLIGLAAGGLAVRAAVAAPLLETLRKE